MQRYRIEWSLSGEHQIPPGPGSCGFGEPLSFQEAEDIVRHYHPTATHDTWLRCDDFKKIVGLTHRAVPVDSKPQVEKVPMGISLQGMRDIVNVLGGQQALIGVSTGEVFKKYAEATKLEDPVTPLTKAVRKMLGLI